MRVRMTETRAVSTDCFNVRLLNQGETYDLPDSAARHVLRSGWGVEADEGFMTNADLVEGVFQALKPLDPRILTNPQTHADIGKPL